MQKTKLTPVTEVTLYVAVDPEVHNYLQCFDYFPDTETTPAQYRKFVEYVKADLATIDNAELADEGFDPAIREPIAEMFEMVANYGHYNWIVIEVAWGE